MTDPDLHDWDDVDDINDAMHMHFEKWGRWDWADIADEARRVHNVMFEANVEKESAIDAVTTAAVAHASHMVYQALAAALCVDADAIQHIVSQWYENQDALPPPVTITRFMEMVEELSPKPGISGSGPAT